MRPSNLELDQFYTEKLPRIKWLPGAVSRTWGEHGLLLPDGYPTTRLDKRQQLTASMWNAYSKCQRNFALRYIDGLRRAGGYLPLHTGTFSHNLFTTMLLGGKVDIQDECQRWVAELTGARGVLESQGIDVFWNIEKLEEMGRVVADMAQSWAHRWQDDPLEALGVALRGRVPLRSLSGRRHPEWDYGFEFDGIIRDSQFGDLWVWEFKTTAMSDRAAYESYIEHDPQAWGYSWAATQIFGRPVGIVYDVCRKKITKGPRLLLCKKAACKKLRAEYYPDKPSSYFVAGKGGELEGRRLPGEDSCECCGGTGFIGISTSRFALHMPSLEGAIVLLERSPKATEQISSDGFCDFQARVKHEWDSLHFRIWRRATPEYHDAFQREAYEVAREMGKKMRVGHGSGPQWLSMRGSCADFTGRGCSFTPICPSINGSGFDLFETRDTEGPVELAGKPDVTHDTGVISF